MAVVITQGKLDKAVEKVVKAETRRCIAAVKAIELADGTTGKVAIKAAVAAIKAE